jgi:hypothetical protein
MEMMTLRRRPAVHASLAMLRGRRSFEHFGGESATACGDNEGSGAIAIAMPTVPGTAPWASKDQCAAQMPWMVPSDAVPLGARSADIRPCN